MRALVTGITGFVGSHLADFLAREQPGVEIHGLARWRSPLENLRGRLDDLTLHHGDLRDLSSLVGVIDATRPDYVFHLAAQSYVPTSFTAPADTLEVNVVGTTNLLEAIRLVGVDPVIHVCSSSEVYGQVGPEDVPIRESCPLRPVSPYGVGKVGTDLIADVYHRAHGLRTIRSRMFTHSGPRRGEVFVDSWFALQLARIEAERQEPVLRVGNLESVRTFCDVRDTVRAYWALVRQGRVGEVYNIGGATTMTIREMLDLLLSFSKQAGQIEVRTDPTLLRPTDVTLQIPCTDKFTADTGWQPEIPYPQTLRDMLDYWRDRVAQGSA